jgi:hypothetical protein
MSVKNVKQYNTMISWLELLILRIHGWNPPGPDSYRPVDWELAVAIHELAGGLSDGAAKKSLQGVAGKLIVANFRQSA